MMNHRSEVSRIHSLRVGLDFGKARIDGWMDGWRITGHAILGVPAILKSLVRASRTRTCVLQPAHFE